MMSEIPDQSEQGLTDLSRRLNEPYFGPLHRRFDPSSFSEAVLRTDPTLAGAFRDLPEEGNSAANLLNTDPFEGRSLEDILWTPLTPLAKKIGSFVRHIRGL